MYGRRIRKNAIWFLPAFLIFLAACGRSSQTPASVSPTPSPFPAIRYSAEARSIGEGESGFETLYVSESGIYALRTEKTGEDIPESVVKEAQKKGREPVNDGRYDVIETFLYHISNDGKLKKLEKFISLPGEENEAGWKDFFSTSELCGLTVADDGTLITLERTNSSGLDVPEGVKNYSADDTRYAAFSTKWYLRKLDAKTGRELSCHAITCEDGTSFDGDSILWTDGFLMAISRSSIGSGVSLVNPEGEVSSTLLVNGEAKGLLRLNDGSEAVWVYKGNASGTIDRLDAGALRLEECYVLPDGVSQVYSGAGDYAFLYSDGVRLTGFRSGGMVDEPLFTWSSVGIRSAAEGRLLSVNADDTISTVTNENPQRILCLSPEETGTENTAVILTLLSENPDGSLKDAVAQFNRDHSDRTIEIVPSCPEGEEPDIVDLSALDFRTACRSGQLEDLYPYLDADSELSRDDFLANVLRAVEVDGHLFCTCAGFSIDTVLAASSLVGDGPGWTYEEYNRALAALGEDGEPFDAFCTREEIFRTCLAMELDWFVDYENRYSNFDNENFAALLSFICSLPENGEGNQTDAEDSTDIRISEGRQLLLRTSLYCFDDAVRAGFEFDEDFSFIGYPSVNGTGTTLRPATLAGGQNLAMWAGSDSKEDAWQFLRVFFTENYQKKSRFFPSDTELFNARFRDYRLEYLVDDDGDVLYDKQGRPRPRALGTMYRSDWTEVTYYGFDEAKADRFYAMVTSITKTPDENETILRLIDKETEAFFHNQMTAQQAASACQKAVMEYFTNQRMG